MKRSAFVTGTAAAAVSGAVLGAAPAPKLPVSGDPVPALAAFDRLMLDFMRKYDVPAGQCAVAKDGRLVYARGFGHADQKRTVPVSPDARFRIASSSKPITAVGVMKLVESGDLGLEERAFAILSDFAPPPGAHVDPRLHRITVRHLLEHSGGFDSTVTDPQFDALRVAADALGHRRPATHDDIIRWMMGRPLAFDPGTKYVYSNLGYNILGRIIEHRSGQTYGSYTLDHVLRPAGARSMALMGRTSPSARLPGEVFYYDGDSPTQWPVYEDDAHVRMISYGAFDGTAIDAHGGWIAHSVDLVRFLNAVGGTSGTQLLKPRTVRTMLARPALAQYRNASRFYALGWDVSPGVVMSHNGALTFGTLSTITRIPGGVTFAMLFDHLAADYVAMVTELARRSAAAAGSVTRWPAKSL